MRQIEALKEVIISQVELFDKRRNRIIQMFVAIYVPLAFATVRVPVLTRHWNKALTEAVILRHEYFRQLRFNRLDQHHINLFQHNSQRCRYSTH